MSSVSVIIPTFNRAHLVGEAINSVLSQTFADFELIVVDDGSTDNTKEVVRSFTDPRLRYFKQANRGVSAAFNTGIQAAKGQIVAFLNDDDIFLPEKLALQMPMIDGDPEIGLVYGWYYVTTSLKAPMRLIKSCFPQLGLRRLLLDSAFHWSTVLVRRSWLEQIGEFDEQFRVGTEWELTLRLALAGCQMACVPKPLIIVRSLPVRLTRDLPRHQATETGILDKIFNDPRMPAELLDLRDLARASQLIRIAASAYSTSQLEMGRDILQHALETYPSLASEHFDFLVDLLVYRIRGLSLDDPKVALQQVTQYLPGDNTFLKKLKRRLWGRFYEIAAFQSHQLDQRAKCIAYAIRAVGITPSCLRNRGLVSIFVRSLVGNWIIDEFKSLSNTLRKREAR